MFLKDFGDYCRLPKYFPSDKEPDLESFGADIYSLAGQFSSNLALLTRTPLMTRRLLQNEKCDLGAMKKHLRRVTESFAKPGADYDHFIDEMSRLLLDYNDFQASTRSIAKGNLRIIMV